MKISRAIAKDGTIYQRIGEQFEISKGGQPARGSSGARKMFDAAMQNRLTTDWTVSRMSADAELQGRIPIIRSRSRDLEQNDPHVENFLKLRENNVVGHDGFTLQMKVKLSEDLDPATGEMRVVYDTAASRAIEKGWNLFCQKANFLVTRTLGATDACKLIERTEQRDGDLLIRKIRGAPNVFGFALQLLESDYLDDQYIDFRGVTCNCPYERRLPDGKPFPFCERGLHEVRMGVELHGDWKFPVAYWLLANHPGDYFFGNNISPRRIRVPVEDIIHPFVYKRIEQTRGIPATVASMLRLQMLGGYDEASLVAARAGAQKMGIITKSVPEEMAADFDPNALGGRVLEGSPGELLELPMGFDIKSIDWNNPTEAYADFTIAQKRAAACGLGVSYASFANDPSDANFSATRIGMLEEREGYRGGQGSFITNILCDVYPDFLEAGMLRGIIDLPFSRWDDFTDAEAVKFHGRSFPWVDPLKDIQAATEAIELGIGTRTEFAAEAGKDFEEVTATLAREKQMRDAAGLSPVPPPITGAPTDAGNPAESGNAKPEAGEPGTSSAKPSPVSGLPSPVSDAPDPGAVSYASLPLLPGDSKPLTDFAASIDPEDIYTSDTSAGFGIENDPHITALYGIHTQDATQAAAPLGDMPPVRAQLGEASVFSDPEKPYDVLHAEVRGGDIHRLNARLRTLPHTNDYPDFRPHATIAYLKKGAGAKYSGPQTFTGQNLEFPALTFSTAQRLHTQIPFVKKKALS